MVPVLLVSPVLPVPPLPPASVHHVHVKTLYNLRMKHIANLLCQLRTLATATPQLFSFCKR